MGGKTNQAQRTKNSARPSNSGRSAEFLQGTSYTFSGFLDNASSPTTGVDAKASFDTTPINEEIASVDPNIQVVLKKLTKKDAVTKGKALLELTQLIAESDIDVVKAVLPLWPRLYKSLYADISHRVRGYCQQAHTAFVVKLAKQIAPILKQICPEWIGSQFDTYAPAASVAKGSLATAFPAHKLKDVLAFCHDEILEYVHRLLLLPMPMPSDKSYTPEEYEARSERLVHMGLSTYTFYLGSTETGLWKAKMDRHQAIVADGKFWSYAKHKSPQVRAAWLEAIGALLDRTQGIVDEFHPKIVPAVVHHLDEGDALVQGAAWTCLLRIQLMVPNWIEHTNVEKALLPKLRRVLSEPNQGIVTHLLPFLSHMNQKVLATHCPRFLTEFFESLGTAMQKTRPGNAQQLKVLVDTYFECLHYVLKRMQTDAEFVTVVEGEKEQWKSGFVSRFLVGPIQWTVAESGARGLAHVARSVGLILGYWSAHGETYRDLWSVFWESVERIVFKEEETAAEDAGSLGSQVQFILSLRKTDVGKCSATNRTQKPSKKVTFGEPQEEEEETSKESPVAESTVRSINWEELFSLGDQLCQRCIRLMIRKPNQTCVKLLFKLLTQFDDQRLVNSIDKVIPMNALADTILGWMADEQIATEEMVDLLICYGTKATPLQEIVDKLLAVESYAVRNWTVLKVAQHGSFNFAESRAIAVYMEHLLIRLINGHAVHESQKMLEKYFDQTLDRNSPAIPENHCTMIELMCTEIGSGAVGVTEARGLNALTRYLLHRISATEVTNSILIRLFLTVFQMHLNGVDAEESNKVLKDVLRSGKVDLNESLLTLCMTRINQKMVESFDAECFELDSLLESCLLMLLPNADNWKIMQPYITLEEANGYLRHLLEINKALVEGVGDLDVDGKSIDTLHHFRTIMSAANSFLLRITVVLKSGRVLRDSREEVMRTVTGLKSLQPKELEDPRLSTVLDEILLLTREIDPDSAKTFKEIALEGDAETRRSACSPKEALTNETEKISIEVASLRHQLAVSFSGDQTENTIEDKAIIRQSIELLSRIIPLARTRHLNLMYNAKADQLEDNGLLLAADLAGLLTVLVQTCPSEFSPEHWDFLRIAMSSWILTISNAMEERHSRITLYRFITAVLRLFDSLMTFFESERQKSSTQLFCKVIEEWNTVFAREVNTVLLLILHKLMASARAPEKNKYLLHAVLPHFQRMNFIYVIVSPDISKHVSQHQLLNAIFGQLSHPVPEIRSAVSRLICRVIPHLVARDNDQLQKTEASEGVHYLATLIAPLLQHTDFDVEEFIADFQYKFTEGAETTTTGSFDEQKITAYFYLWNAVLLFCRNATPELRASYAEWIASRGMESVLLRMIFRLLPQDVIRNFDAKSSMVESYFGAVKGLENCDKSINTEQLVCYTYLNLVRLLPAVVRKCWTNLPHRTNMLIEKFNMFYASSLLCNEELRALMEKREKMDNIQISVHHSTREIIAVYAKEEARMELMITLPLNYPLAVAKVEGGKSVNSRIQSKEVLMQLNLFLSHQNGTIYNGLSLWKRNLDKKFDGVEECYVCYSVIHPDTYQLPKLTCKTCKKKFHSPCLYRWFSTSNKSTCPICRNIF